MTRLFLIIFVTFLSAKEIKISSYNIENLFDLKNTGREYPIYKKGSSACTIVTYLKKLNNLSSVISAIDADIIALQEVESEKALKDLNHNLKFHGKPYKYWVFGRDSSRSNTATAILSKFPIISSSTHKVTLPGRSFTRPILQATIQIDTANLTLFVVHWPSKRSGEIKRVITAKKLMELVNKLPKNSEYIILGDFNSDYDEAQNLLTDGLDNSGGVSGLSHILATTPAKVGEQFFPATAADVQTKKAIHYSPWIEVESEWRYSYIFRGEKNALDHILFPRSLLDDKRFCYKPNSFAPFNFEKKLTNGYTPFRWQMEGGWGNRQHIGEGYSDHLPVVATLLLNEKKDSPYFEPKFFTPSFEVTQDGWIIGNAKFHLDNSTQEKVDGEFSLKIKGTAKENCTVLKVTGVVSKIPISFFVKGVGVTALRWRKVNEKWSYINSKKKISKSANGSYRPVSKEWKNIIIKDNLIKIGDTVSVEIRSKKDIPLTLFIDNANFNGWFRGKQE